MVDDEVMTFYVLTGKGQLQCVIKTFLTESRVQNYRKTCFIIIIIIYALFFCK